MTSKEQIRILNTYGKVSVILIGDKWWSTLTMSDGFHSAVKVSESKNLSINGLYKSVAEELYLETA